jgi:MFS family permease
LFQVGNASLVPLVTGRLGHEHAGGSVLITAGAILVPQLAAALIATRIAHEADALGRKPLLLLGLGAVAARAILFAATSSPWVLLPIQLLDGFSAAIVGVMTPLVIADLMRGTGRYNLAQGFSGTATGLGGALSTGTTGYVAQHFGYATAFLGLAFVALIGAAILYCFLPETKPATPKS